LALLGRTSRVVLFTIDENDRRGARAYALAYETDLPRTVMAFETDSGGVTLHAPWQ